jgi:hypothetical protein
VSTFENGWICRECWSANRDVDDRCYRCHVDRPLGAPVAASEQTKNQSAAEPVAAAPNPVSNEEEVAAAVATATAPRAGRYCLRCGAAWLPGAGFCTQCGTAVLEAASEADEPAATTVVQPARSPAIRVPHVSLPRFKPAQALERVRAALLAYYPAHERAWEGAMSAMAIGFAVLGITADRLSGPVRGAVLFTLLAITIVFVVEYAVRALAARDRRAFVRGHLVELAAVLPWVRPVRVARFIWVVGLRSFVVRMQQRRSREPWVRPNLRWSKLVIIWCVLLVVSAAATLGYLAGGDSPDRAVRFALVVMLLCVFSSLTAALTTAFAAAGIGTSDVASRLRALDKVRDDNLITPDEYLMHRAALLRMLSPAQADGHAGYAATHTDRATQASGAS